MYKQFLEGIKIQDNTMNSSGGVNQNMYGKQGKQFNTISASQSNQHGLAATPVLQNAHGPRAQTSFQNSNGQPINDGTKSTNSKMGKVNQKTHLRSLTQ